MKRFTVRLPIAATVEFSVFAKDEEAAIELAIETAPLSLTFRDGLGLVLLGELDHSREAITWPIDDSARQVH